MQMRQLCILKIKNNIFEMNPGLDSIKELGKVYLQRNNRLTVNIISEQGIPRDGVIS